MTPTVPDIFIPTTAAIFACRLVIQLKIKKEAFYVVTAAMKWCDLLFFSLTPDIILLLICLYILRQLHLWFSERRLAL